MGIAMMSPLANLKLKLSIWKPALVLQSAHVLTNTICRGPSYIFEARFDSNLPIELNTRGARIIWLTKLKSKSHKSDLTFLTRTCHPNKSYLSESKFKIFDYLLKTCSLLKSLPHRLTKLLSSAKITRSLLNQLVTSLSRSRHVGQIRKSLWTCKCYFFIFYVELEC